MVNDSILKLTDQTELAAAWKAIFPSSLTATSKIAIKVPLGYASAPCGPDWRHVRAIIDGLKLMDFNGTKFSGSITIYDSAGGNNFSAFGFNATNFPDAQIVRDSLQTFSDGAGGRQYAKTLGNANFLINVFTPRGHSSFGLTLGFKNHFGTYEPNALHGGGIESINTSGAVYNKTVLCVCSAIYANLEGQGPSQGPTNYSAYAKKMDSTATITSANTLILSTDPISAEMQGIKIMRMNSGGGYATNNMPGYLTNSQSIGVISEASMDIRKLINVTTEVNMPNSGKGTPVSSHISATHLNGHASTFVQYALPASHIGQNISFEIYDVKGNIVRKLTDKALGIVSHFSWDEKDVSNNLVHAGNYVIRLIAGSTQMSSQFAIVR